MGIENIVQIQISRQTQGVSRVGFGVPLIIGPNASFAGIREYASLAAVLVDFADSTGEYKAAAAMFAQTPKPTKVKIAKATTPVAQVSKVVIATVANASAYTVTINGVAYTITSDADATKSEIQTALIAAINAGTEPVTASANVDDIDVTADNDGEPFTITVGTRLTVSTPTPNVGIAGDIAAYNQADPDWYALVTVAIDDVTVKQAAATIEALPKSYIVRRNDAAIKTASTTDIASVLKALGYNRTAVFYLGTADNYADAALLGRMLPEDPGSATYAFKTLPGVVADSLTDAERGYLDGKNVIYYETVAGVSITKNGKMVGGEYIDIMIGIDWLQARMQERIYQQLVTLKKIPFTDAGIAIIENEMKAQLEEAMRKGVAASYTTTVPRAADVSSIDKAARLLPDMQFTAVFSGAVHKTEVQGIVTL